MGSVVDCLSCLGEATATLKLDRHGRPTTRCGLCGTRTFISSRAGLRGLVYFAPSVRGVLQSLAAAGGLRSIDDAADGLAVAARAAMGGIR